MGDHRQTDLTIQHLIRTSLSSTLICAVEFYHCKGMKSMSLLKPPASIKSPRKHLWTGSLHFKVGSTLQVAHDRAIHLLDSLFIAQLQEIAGTSSPWIGDHASSVVENPRVTRKTNNSSTSLIKCARIDTSSSLGMEGLDWVLGTCGKVI